ncbi:hypothetical protein PsorP6_002835 [Peronosclerospora sorghi]|uniref:Uncharacterized protein n=1 Tax=Peronosclerospora sorghi TaxID=230839 RepID=A0ACC0VN88_9STRA|nr:hypothetical protein PsorP6_002835 [Peronosclerospora sorghi]
MEPRADAVPVAASVQKGVSRGTGPSVFIYATRTGELLSEHVVLTRGILHDWDIVQPALDSSVGVFYGQKRVSYCTKLPPTCDAARKIKTFPTLGIEKVFCDWILDAHVLVQDDRASQETKTLLVVVELSHNMVQIWDPERQTILRSVQCVERCILYSLAFHGRSFDELMVASGTVFQQILLWNPMEKAGQQSSVVVAPVQRLHAHDGVLFKLPWTSDASSLVSVSDDRTVKFTSDEFSDKKTYISKQIKAKKNARRLANCAESKIRSALVPA